MNLLALDAARGGFSVAVLCASRTAAVAERPGGAALEQGLAAVSQALRETGLEAADLDGIAAGTGPGSFTGVRIALGYAKSLAQAWRLPLTGVNTFDALEAGLTPERPLLTVVRGRTGVVSVRFQSGEPGDEPWRASGYITDVLERFGRGRRLNVLGDAEDVLPGLAERGWNVHLLSPPAHPTALGVAIAAASRKPARSVHEVRADYGELPAVNPKGGSRA